MKYCVHCGAELHDEAVVCIKCGCSACPKVQTVVHAKNNDDALATVAKVFLIIACVTQGWMLIPLAWCLPMTISVFHSLRDNRPISTGMKVCVLLFVSLISGIMLLCMHDDN